MVKLKTKVHKYRRNDGTPVRTHTRKIDVDVFKPEKQDNTFENKDDSPSIEIDKDLIQKNIKKVEQPRKLSYDDVKAPEKEGDKPRMPGKISGGTEFNGAVSYILGDHKNVMKLKVNSSEIRGGNLRGVDVSKQKEEIRNGIKYPIVAEYSEKDKKYFINDGEHRFEAYNQLGIKEDIPIITQHRVL